jgi:hypothetical protein
VKCASAGPHDKDSRTLYVSDGGMVVSKHEDVQKLSREAHSVLAFVETTSACACNIRLNGQTEREAIVGD